MRGNRETSRGFQVLLHSYNRTYQSANAPVRLLRHARGRGSIIFTDDYHSRAGLGIAVVDNGRLVLGRLPPTARHIAAHNCKRVFYTRAVVVFVASGAVVITLGGRQQPGRRGHSTACVVSDPDQLFNLNSTPTRMQPRPRERGR